MKNETLTRIETLIQNNNLTANKVAVACKLQSNTFTYWKNGTTKPSIDALVKIADYFNVSLDYLIGRETPTTAIQSQQNTVNNATTSPLLNKFAQLNELQQTKVMAYIDGLQSAETTIKTAFRQGQELEKQKQPKEVTMQHQQKKFN